MRVSCPTCSKPYLVPDAKIPAQGARIRCKQCSDRFVVKPFPSDFARQSFGDIGLVWTLKRADGTTLTLDCYADFEALELEGLLTPHDTLTFDNEAFPTLRQLADVKSWMWEIWRRVEDHRLKVPAAAAEEETGDSPTFNGLFRGDREQAFRGTDSDDTSGSAPSAASFEEATLPSAPHKPLQPPPVNIEGPTNAELAPKPTAPKRVAPPVVVATPPPSSSVNDPLGLLSSIGRPSQKGTPRVRPSPASRPQSSTPSPAAARQPPPVAGIRNPGRSYDTSPSNSRVEPMLDAEPKTEEVIFELPPMPENAKSTGISPFHLLGGLVAALALVLFPFSLLILGFLG